MKRSSSEILFREPVRKHPKVEYRIAPLGISLDANNLSREVVEHAVKLDSYYQEQIRNIDLTYEVLVQNLNEQRIQMIDSLKIRLKKLP